MAGGHRAARGTLDHLVFGVSDLAVGIEDLTHRLGVRPTEGGSHPGRGSANALVGLGPGCYLEIIGPDPQQPAPAQPRSSGIDHLTEPRLVAWAVRVDGLDEAVRHARRAGYDPGDARGGARRRPDGVELRWRLAMPAAGGEWLPEAGGVVPFLIDWGDSPHPSDEIPCECRLASLRAEHPEADRVARMLAALEVELPVRHGDEPRLIATLESPHGVVELR